MASECSDAPDSILRSRTTAPNSATAERKACAAPMPFAGAADVAYNYTLFDFSWSFVDDAPLANETDDRFIL
jgi:hypothetical protein